MLIAITMRGLQMSPRFVISAGLPHGLGSVFWTIDDSSSVQPLWVYLWLSHFQLL